VLSRVGNGPTNSFTGHADTDANADTHTDANAESDADRNADAYSDAYSDTDADTYAHTDADTDADANTDSVDLYADAYGDGSVLGRCGIVLVHNGGAAVGNDRPGRFGHRPAVDTGGQQLERQRQHPGIPDGHLQPRYGDVHAREPGPSGRFHAACTEPVQRCEHPRAVCRRRPDAYSDADTHADAYSNTNADTDTDTNADTDAYADAYADADADTRRNVYADADGDGGFAGRSSVVLVNNGGCAIGDGGPRRFRGGADLDPADQCGQRERQHPGIPIRDL
jgi:hypothetical protein